MAPTGVRVLGVDLGSKWIGLSISNSEATVAVPRGALRRCGQRALDHAQLARIVEEDGVGAVVVGLPLSMDGEAGQAARSVLEEIEELSALLGVPVEAHDERLSTVSASRSADRGAPVPGGTRGRAAGSGRASRRSVPRSVRRSERDGGQRDARAATVILQSYLDAAPPGHDPA